MKLKPCPFLVCGGAGELITTSTYHHLEYFGRCTKCDVETALYRTKKEAVEAWNTRSDD